MSKRVYGLFTLLLVASVLLTACGGAAAPTQAPVKATTAPAVSYTHLKSSNVVPGRVVRGELYAGR